MTDIAELSLRYPADSLAARQRAASEGSFRDRVRFDLVDRPHHAFGLLAAADMARFAGVEALVAIEFGVAEGTGLLNMCSVAGSVADETGIEIRVVGFDAGTGLPPPVDYRDHPEIWAEGDFSGNVAKIRAALPQGSELVIGPVAETVPSFIGSLGDHVVGFVSFDLDLYSSTRDALSIFSVGPTNLLPVVISHFDDVIGGPRRIGSLFRNAAAGQLLAIDEFNRAHRLRQLDRIRSLAYRRPFDRELWLERMYGLHVLDHPLRNASPDRPGMSMTEHAGVRRFEWPL